MDNYFIVEYTKVNHFPNNVRKVKERRTLQTLDNVFEILRFSNHCKRELGLKFLSCSYMDGTINPKTNREDHWINEDISIRSMTDEDLLEV